MSIALVRQPSRKIASQKGSIMIMAVFIVAIMAVLISGWSAQRARELSMLQAERAGESLNALSQLVSLFMARHYSSIDSQWTDAAGGDVRLTLDGTSLQLTPGAGKWVLVKPEDIQAIVRQPGLSIKSPLYDNAFKVAIRADIVAGQRRFTTLSYLARPLTIPGGKPDLAAIRRVASAIGAHAVMSLQTPSQLTERADQRMGNPPAPVVMPNPVFPAQAGVVGALGGISKAQLTSYLPRDGTRPMEGRFQLSGHDVVDVGDLHASTLALKKLSARDRILDVRPGGSRIMNVDGTVDISNKIEISATLDRKSAAAGEASAESIRVDEQLSADRLSANGELTVLTRSSRATSMTSASLNIKQQAEVDKLSAYRVEAEEDVVAKRSLESREGVVHLRGAPYRKNDRCGRSELGSIALDAKGNMLLCRTSRPQERGTPYWAGSASKMELSWSESFDSFRCYPGRRRAEIPEEHDFCGAYEIKQNACGADARPTRTAEISRHDSHPRKWILKLQNAKVEVRCYRNISAAQQ